MPKVKTNRVKYPEGWELIEPTLRELQAKMREGDKKLWRFKKVANFPETSTQRHESMGVENHYDELA